MTDDAGYGKPPPATQIKKGSSGNPRGRPKNRHKLVPYDAVLGQMVTIREDGRERRVTAVLQLTQKGLAGDSGAARDWLDAIGNARSVRGNDRSKIETIIVSSISTGADAIFESIGLAKLKYPADKDRVRWELNPWIVEAAVARLGEEQLTIEDQREVWSSTRTPCKCHWPEWWEWKGK